MNVVKKFVDLAMNAVAEIVVKGCSRVLLGLLTTGKSDTGSYATVAAVPQI